MDKVRLKNIIDSCDNDYDSLYEKIINIEKDKTDFDMYYYKEIVYMCLYLFHSKYGIDKLSKNGIIPNLIPKDMLYDQFKKELEKYKRIDFHNKLLPDETNLFEEIWRLSETKLLSRDGFYWTKVYSSSINKSDFEEYGKLYVSIDNQYLYQFACLMLVNCLSNGIEDFEFKVNNDKSTNRVDNMVIYFTQDNLSKYLEIIETTKNKYPEIMINPCHMLGEELSDGVAIAKDYFDGYSFTEGICNTVLQLKERNVPTEVIVNIVDEDVLRHLQPILSNLNSKKL